MPAKTPAKATRSKIVLPDPPQYNLGADSDDDPSQLFDLTLPSGQRCQARRPGIQGLIEAGMLDSFDQLTSIVQQEHIEPKTPQGIARAAKVTDEQAAAAATALAMDKDKLAAALLLMDKLTVYVVTQPKLWVDYKMMVDVPGSKEQREETDDEFNKREELASKSKAVAVRRVKIDDKMFLLNWAVGGSGDLAPFRPGSE